ncbi:MAG: hypothetical protein NUW22_10125 [Acidobacteria bacterium]|nr:hypothetical protein [Acidobacteriota bacterium]
MIPRLAGAMALVGTSILTSTGLSVDASASALAQGKGKPKAALRVNPALIFPPARVVATAELTEGANDFQDYYCPKIEWIWGDGTQSGSGEDCEPYEAGTSEIRRRYSADHNYRGDPMSGATSYDVVFRMKQGSKTVLSLRQTIKVQGP